MKTNTTLAVSFALIATASLAPFLLSGADEKKGKPSVAIPADRTPAEVLRLPGELPAPVVPPGTKLTEDIKTTIALINSKLIAPIRSQSSQRALMSRVRVRMDIEYHFAITDTSDSLYPFDLYTRHLSGDWEKIASGVCSPGMESVKVAMPETGVMVEPSKHPLFAAAFIGRDRLVPTEGAQSQKAG